MNTFSNISLDVTFPKKESRLFIAVLRSKAASSNSCVPFFKAFFVRTIESRHNRKESFCLAVFIKISEPVYERDRTISSIFFHRISIPSPRKAETERDAQSPGPGAPISTLLKTYKHSVLSL